MAGEEEWEVCLCGTSEDRPRTRSRVLLSSTDIWQPRLVRLDQEMMKELGHGGDRVEEVEGAVEGRPGRETVSCSQ